MRRTRLEVRYYVLLLPILFGLLASCFASANDETASQGQPNQAGQLVVTVFKPST
jgi:hypothetical protein